MPGKDFLGCKEAAFTSCSELTFERAALQTGRRRAGGSRTAPEWINPTDCGICSMGSGGELGPACVGAPRCRSSCCFTVSAGLKPLSRAGCVATVRQRSRAVPARRTAAVERGAGPAHGLPRGRLPAAPGAATSQFRLNSRRLSPAQPVRGVSALSRLKPRLLSPSGLRVLHGWAPV